MSKYGQVGADGIWKNKEGDTGKTDDKKGTKSDKQQKIILKFMEIDKEYLLQDFFDLLGLKETWTKKILKPLILNGKIFVIEKIEIDDKN